MVCFYQLDLASGFHEPYKPFKRFSGAGFPRYRERKTLVNKVETAGPLLRPWLRDGLNLELDVIRPL
jgi:hypothetical protein